MCRRCSGSAWVGREAAGRLSMLGDWNGIGRANVQVGHSRNGSEDGNQEIRRNGTRMWSQESHKPFKTMSVQLAPDTVTSTYRNTCSFECGASGARCMLQLYRDLSTEQELAAGAMPAARLYSDTYLDSSLQMPCSGSQHIISTNSDTASSFSGSSVLSRDLLTPLPNYTYDALKRQERTS